MQYYAGYTEIPSEIYLSHEIENMGLYSDWLSKLSGHKITLSLPQRGEKKKTLDLVEKNAKEYVLKFQERIDKEVAFRSQADHELMTLLALPENLQINRIEAFDISNTSGVYSVGSMVVFEQGKKKRSDYRRYRVKTIEGANDYGSMQEVIYRRYKRGIEEAELAKSSGVQTGLYRAFPDLILIDGGKGHVNAVLDIMQALKLYIPVAGMVKDDFHKTEDLLFNGERLGLKQFKNAFKMVYEIQEEVHRFAIEYHKSLRSREMVHSQLDEIEGVGEKRRIALLKHFKNIEAIKAASVETLMEVQGISLKVAQAIYQFFRTS